MMIPSKKKKVHQRVHHYTLSTTKFSGKDRVAIVLDLLTTTRSILKDLKQPQRRLCSKYGCRAP